MGVCFAGLSKATSKKHLTEPLKKFWNLITQVTLASLRFKKEEAKEWQAKNLKEANGASIKGATQLTFHSLGRTDKLVREKERLTKLEGYYNIMSR